MDTCYANYHEPIYSPAMMTPPPEDLDCNFDVRPPRQIFSFREPPTPDYLPSMSAFTTPTRYQSSLNSCQPGRRSPATSDSIFAPREPSELLRERDYIGAELKRHSQRKEDLIRQYSVAEDNLNQVSTLEPKQRRRMRKKLSKVRGMLNEAGNTERTLAIRWNELCLELKSHETWAKAQWERQAINPPEYFTLSPLSMTQDSSWKLDTCQSPQHYLDATSPEFTPRGIFIEDIMASSSQRNLETVDETGEECTVLCDNASEDEWEAGENFEETEEPESQRRCSHGDEIFLPKERRLSLPNMPCGF